MEISRMRIFPLSIAASAGADSPPAGRQRRPQPRRRSAARRIIGSTGLAVAATATLLAFGGCGDIKRSPSGAISVTVAPGQTGTCAISPCRIFLEMPPGEGEYRVTGNQVDFGSYPAGRTVNLGDFYEPQAIEIVGAGVPKAYVYLPIYR